MRKPSSRRTPVDARGMHDLPALSGRLREAGTFQRGEMKGERGRRNAEPGGDFARRQAVRAFGDQQPHQVEPGLLRERRKGSGGFRCFHLSRMAEMTLLNKAGRRRSGPIPAPESAVSSKIQRSGDGSSAGVGMIRRQQSLLPRCWEARGAFPPSIRPPARAQCSDHHRQHRCGCDGLVGQRALGQKPDAVVALKRGDVGARQPEGFSNRNCYCIYIVTRRRAH